VAEPAQAPRPWRRHFVYRTERLRTTWKFRLTIVGLISISLWLTHDVWTDAVDRSLTCEGNAARSDAIIVDNFDVEFLLFERATKLRAAAFADRVIVPIRTGINNTQPEAVALATTRLMADIARVGEIEIVPMREIEPISLNAAQDVLRFVQHEHIRSVILVSPHLRSRRSMLIYQAILGTNGVTVRCEPVRGSTARWTSTWHGIENVAEQWLKLQYYRIYVLPSLRYLG